MHAIERAKNILLRPAATWPVIEAESTRVADMYRNSLLLLALIPAWCGFIGMLLVGYSMFGVQMRMPLVSGLVGIFVLGWIIDALARTFSATRNALQAFKVTVARRTAVTAGCASPSSPA